jgi:hypothetical protein
MCVHGFRFSDWPSRARRGRRCSYPLTHSPLLYPQLGSPPSSIIRPLELHWELYISFTKERFPLTLITIEILKRRQAWRGLCYPVLLQGCANCSVPDPPSNSQTAQESSLKNFQHSEHGNRHCNIQLLSNINIWAIHSIVLHP